MGALCCADSVHCSNVIRAEKFPAVPTFTLPALGEVSVDEVIKTSRK
jgi:hypothetical protein